LGSALQCECSPCCRLDSLHTALKLAQDEYLEHPLPDTIDVVATYAHKHAALIDIFEEAAYAVARGTHTTPSDLPCLFGKHVDTLAEGLRSAMSAYQDARSKHVSLTASDTKRPQKVVAAPARPPMLHMVEHLSKGGLVDQVTGVHIPALP
jgi:hypothetical protein